MSNPQIGDLEDITFLRPAITEHTDPATGEKVGVTWMPSTMSGQVKDAENPAGAPRQITMRNQVILGMDKVEQLRYNEGRPCLACKHFDSVKGQKEIQRQNLAGTIVELGLQLGYNPHAIQLKDWGLCGESGGEKAASPMGTCDHWSPRKKGWKHYMRGASLTAGETITRAAEAVAGAVDQVVGAASGYTVNDRRGEK